MNWFICCTGTGGGHTAFIWYLFNTLFIAYNIYLFLYIMCVHTYVCTLYCPGLQAVRVSVCELNRNESSRCRSRSRRCCRRRSRRRSSESQSQSSRIASSRVASSRVGSRVGQKGDTILVAMTFTAMFKLWRGMLSLLLLLLEHRKKQRSAAQHSTAYKKRYEGGGNK